MKYDYYRINLPGDLFDDKERILDYAIQEARERAKLYVTPCQWDASIENGEIGDYELTIKVRRIRK